MNALFSHWYENDKPKWYFYSKQNGIDKLNYKECQEIINWIYENIDGCIKHSRWQYNDGKLDVKFRYERDYILFVLRWA